MADELIKRKGLIQQIDKASRDDFIKAVQKVGFLVTNLSSGSHYAVRRPGFDPADFKGFVTTVYADMSKQMKMKIFKNLVRAGINEDELWRGLGLLK
ncbi:MAG TPA: hypothetical protein VJG64_01940 [Candidatus Paceibacterota bacterium]